MILDDNLTSQTYDCIDHSHRIGVIIAFFVAMTFGTASERVLSVFFISLLRDLGVTLALVEQNVLMALEIADRGYVFARREIVASGSTAKLSESETLQSAYLGG